MPEWIETEDEARRYDAMFRSASLEGRKPGQSQLNISGATIEDLTPDYLEWVKLYRQPGTYREREYTMRYINKIIGNVPVVSFNDHHISLYQSTRKAQGVSNRTVNKELYYVMAFLKWARKEKKLEIRNLSYEKLKHNTPVPIILSVDEIKRLLEVATPIHRCLFLFLYALGLRWSEAVNIRIRDIDKANSTVLVQQKGGSYKLLPLPTILLSSVGEIVDSDASSEADDFIFRNPATGKAFVNIRKSVAKYCKEAGIQKRVYCHLLRHSFATHLLGHGTPTNLVQAMLGHTTSTMTKHYQHISIEHMRNSGNLLVNALRGDLNENE